MLEGEGRNFPGGDCSQGKDWEGGGAPGTTYMYVWEFTRAPLAYSLAMWGYVAGYGGGGGGGGSWAGSSLEKWWSPDHHGRQYQLISHTKHPNNASGQQGLLKSRASLDLKQIVIMTCN